MSKWFKTNGSFIKTLNKKIVTTVNSIPVVNTSVAWNGLCFTAAEANSSVTFTKPSYISTPEYSTDGKTWTTISSSATISLPNVGDYVFFRGKIKGMIYSAATKIFSGTGKIKASGNCNSMYDASNFDTLDTLTIDNCYKNMFKNCTALITAPDLPAIKLSSFCYESMFEGCKALIKAPTLPATRLGAASYASMFRGCTALTKAPELPATRAVNFCYQAMFYGCSSLLMAPELPATNTAKSCYSSMFSGCSSLKNAPILPMTTLGTNCYYQMFWGCTSLREAPALPATVLADGCYQDMFHKCTSLTQAPKLPVTTLAKACYYGMFEGCKSLIRAPQLPATTLTEDCYRFMFFGCISLIDTPKLPATILTPGCYCGMFGLCSNIQSIPDLSHVTVVDVGSCKWMFERATINYVRDYNTNTLISRLVLNVNKLATECYADMFNASAFTNPNFRVELPSSIEVNTSSCDGMFYNSNYSSTINDFDSIIIDSTASEVHDSFTDMFRSSNISSMMKINTINGNNNVQGLFNFCYYSCVNLDTLSSIHFNFDSSITNNCDDMLYRCPLVKVHTTSGGEYSNQFIIKTNVTSATNIAGNSCFKETSGAYKGDATYNTIYYTSNSVI